MLVVIITILYTYAAIMILRYGHRIRKHNDEIAEKLAELNDRLSSR